MTTQSIRYPVLSLTFALCAALAVTARPGLADDDHKQNRKQDCQRMLRHADLAVLTPVLWEALAPPIFPVQGSDGRVHLAYELRFTNLFPVPVKIEFVEQIDLSGALVATLSGAEVALSLVLSPNFNFSDTLGPFQSGVMLFNLTFENRKDVPKALAHRVTVSLDFPLLFPPEVTALGGCTEVSRRKAIVLSPPLRGDGWFASITGCCDSSSGHRLGILPLNGMLQIAQRFAIDLARVNTEDRLFVGDLTDVTNWVAYGTEVYAAAPGKVITVVRGFSDQVPFKKTDVPLFDSGGNHVVIDMGGGQFAFYAHLAPGSIVVQEGDRVRRGEFLGLLGNTGNSDFPHLHFHVADGPSFNANGVPYVFDQWTFQGRLVRFLFDGMGTVEIDRTGSGERRRKEMPLAFDFIRFRP